MNRYYYDLHLHSCLSPCGDNEATPANIAGMATLAGLQIVALTDHNSTRNCPAFFKAARAYGLIPVAGMELTTAEDIHLLCLFEELADAMDFGEEIEGHRIRIRNRKDIFGDQLIVDEEDNVLGEEEFLLPNATDVTVDDAPALAERFGGICYPAHIDRQANGILAVLGTFPDRPFFPCFGLHDAGREQALREQYPALAGKRAVISSDAHYLQDIRDADACLDLDDEPYSSALVRRRLFEKLRSPL